MVLSCFVSCESLKNIEIFILPLYFSTAENTPQGECIYHRTREEKQKGLTEKVIACRIKEQMKSFYTTE